MIVAAPTFEQISDILFFHFVEVVGVESGEFHLRAVPVIVFEGPVPHGGVREADVLQFVHSAGMPPAFYLGVFRVPPFLFTTAKRRDGVISE